MILRRLKKTRFIYKRRHRAPYIFFSVCIAGPFSKPTVHFRHKSGTVTII
jgi:hypothetical protein